MRDVTTHTPKPHSMGYITCSEDMRAVTEQNALSLREGLDSGHSMNSWNGGLSHGAGVWVRNQAAHTQPLSAQPLGAMQWALWQQTGEGEGLGPLEISGCKLGPHGAHLGHYLIGTVGEQEQMDIRHSLRLCTYNSHFNHVKRKKKYPSARLQ